MLALGLVTLALFLPAVRYGFISFDDDAYVFENPRVLAGLSPSGIRWAFTTVHEQYWLPVLWLSFMTDASLFGPEPWGFHLVSILLHAANALLIFWILLRLTRARWPSAFIAALFAVHPLNVEAVVWITARKDTLSSFFWLLGVLAYVRHAEKPGYARSVWVFVFMLLGLMTKPILVAMPFTLLLLDFWPLRRGVNASAWRGLIVEKWPLFGLSAAFAAINLNTHVSGAISGIGVPWSSRLAMIPGNYAIYLGRLLLPAGLSILHPEADMVNWVNTAVSLAGLGLFSWGVIRVRDRFPFLLVGWGWFLVTLLPVVRGVRLGLAAYADRWTYVPGIGVFLMLAWGGAEWLRRQPSRRAAVASIAALALLSCMVLARAQVRVWASPETLFEQAVSRGPHVVSVGHLATLRDQAGREEDAILLYARALELLPTDPDTHSNIARILARTGRTEQALWHYRRALQLKPAFPGALNNLGLLYQSQRDFAAAEECFLKALQFDPGNYLVHNNLGTIYAMSGRMQEAAASFGRALEIAPHRADVRANYERALRARR